MMSTQLTLPAIDEADAHQRRYLDRHRARVQLLFDQLPNELKDELAQLLDAMRGKRVRRYARPAGSFRHERRTAAEFVLILPYRKEGRFFNAAFFARSRFAGRRGWLVERDTLMTYGDRRAALLHLCT